MEGKARILGHSAHPILIVFPLGLLATAVIFDVIHMIWGNPVFATVSYWMIVAGIVGGIVRMPIDDGQDGHRQPGGGDQDESRPRTPAPPAGRARFGADVDDVSRPDLEPA